MRTAAILMVIAACCVAAEPPLITLMTNPGAEPLGTRRDHPPGHSPAVTRTGDRYRWCPEAARTGTMGIRLILNPDQAYGSISLGRPALNAESLYRLSVHYRTHQEGEHVRVFRLWAGRQYIQYPTAADWTPAHLILRGQDTTALKMDATAMVDDPDGLKGERKPVALTVDVDDFDFRELTDHDFRGNLIENPGFEQGDTYPCGWLRGHAGSVRADADVKHTGRRSLRLDIPAGKTGAIRTNYLPLRSGCIYVVSFWLRLREQTHDQTTFALVAESGRNRIQLWAKHAAMLTPEWREYRFFFETPIERVYPSLGRRYTATFGVGLRSKKKANCLWLDDVAVSLFEPE